MTSDVMANGTREKWDPGEPEVQRNFLFVALLTLNDTHYFFKLN